MWPELPLEIKGLGALAESVGRTDERLAIDKEFLCPHRQQ